MEAVSTGEAPQAASMRYAPYDEAQQFAASLKLNSRKEWREYVKGLHEGKEEKPKTVPAHPDGIYKNRGWQGWRRWLGTEIPQQLREEELH